MNRAVRAVRAVLVACIVVASLPPTPARAQGAPYVPDPDPDVSIDAKAVLQKAPSPALALVVPNGHSAKVKNVAFSPDGRLLVTGSEDTTAKLWDAATGVELRTFTPLTSPPLALAVSASNLVAIATYGPVDVFDALSGRKLASLAMPDNGWAHALAFLPDGKTVVLGTHDGTVKLWDLTTGRKRIVARGDEVVRGLAVSADGSVIIAGLENGRIIKVTLATGTQRDLGTAGGRLTGLAMSADGRTAASATFDGVVKLWDVAAGVEARTLPAVNRDGRVAVSPDGRLVAYNGDMARLRLYDTAKGSAVEAAADGPAFSFSPDGKQLAVADYTSVGFLDVRTNKKTSALREPPARPLRAVALSPQGKQLAFADDRGVWLVDLGTGRLARRMPAALTEAIAFTADGKRLVAGFGERAVGTFDVAKGNWENATVAGRPSADGRRVVQIRELYMRDSVMVVSDVATSRTLATLAHQWVATAVLSRDGRLLASGGGGEIKVFDVDSGRELVEGKAYTGGRFWSIAFSKDASRIAAGAENGVHIFDAASGRELCAWSLGEESSDDFVGTLAFSPDGKLLATGGWYGPMHLLDTATCRVRTKLAGHASKVSDVSFSADGRLLVSAAEDRSVHLYDLVTGARAVIMTFSGSEWVVARPDGTFDGTPGAFKLIYLVQGQEALPLDAFFEKLYTPNLLPRLLSATAGGSGVAPAAPEGASPVKLPPRVTIVSPSNGASFKAAEVDVVVEATDQGGGIDDVSLYQNGKLVGGEGGERGVQRLSGAKVQRTFHLSLSPGSNTLRATAFNTERTEATPVEITVTLARAEASARLYVVAVGVNDYKNPKYRLTYARGDAEAIVALIERKAKRIFATVKKTVLYDAQATKAGILGALEAVAKEARPQDALVFFFAGHGVMSEGGEGTPADFFLVGADVTQMMGNDAQLASGGVSAQELKALTGRIQAQKQLVLLDACQSGGAVEAFAMRGAAEEKAIMQLARSTGAAVIASTSTEQYAAEFKALGHGAFTYALLAGLGGEADGGTPPDGKITVKELEGYLNDKVPELTQKYLGEAQYPNSWSRGMDFPVGVK